jgi:serine/threonine protein kinase
MEGRTLQSGRYTVGCQIGLGNYGVVYEGLDTRQRLKVAIKVLAPHVLANKELLDITLLEIDILKKIHHPHIIKLLDNFEEGPNFFLVYNFCEKGDLKATIDSKGKMSEEDALKLVFQCSQALCELSRHTIIHRDIKPENIFLTGDICQLGDFGLCYVGPNGQLGASVGSLGFLAPETQKYQYYSAKADVYSLGICFFEMMHGDIPFTTPELDVLYQTKLNLQIQLGPQTKLTPFGRDLMVRMTDPNESSRISCEEITQILNSRFSNSLSKAVNQSPQDPMLTAQPEENRDKKPSYLADHSRRGLKHQKASSHAMLPDFSRPQQFFNGIASNQNQIGYPERDQPQLWIPQYEQPQQPPLNLPTTLVSQPTPQQQYLQAKVQPMYSVSKQATAADLKFSEPNKAPKAYEQQYGSSSKEFAQRPSYTAHTQSYLHAPRDQQSRNAGFLNSQPAVQTVSLAIEQPKQILSEWSQPQPHYKPPDKQPILIAPQPRSSTPSKNFVSDKFLEKEVPVHQILELPIGHSAQFKPEYPTPLSSYQKYIKHSSSAFELPSPGQSMDHKASSNFGMSQTQNYIKLSNNFIQSDKQAQVLLQPQSRIQQTDRSRIQRLDSSPPPSFLSREHQNRRAELYTQPPVTAPLNQSVESRYPDQVPPPLSRPSYQPTNQQPIFHDANKQYSPDKNHSPPEYFRPKATQNVQKFIDEPIFNVGGQTQMMSFQSSMVSNVPSVPMQAKLDRNTVPELALFSTDDYRDRDRKEYKKIVDMVAGTRDTSNWPQPSRKEPASIFATGWENEAVELRTLESPQKEMASSVNHSFVAYKGAEDWKPIVKSLGKQEAIPSVSEFQENPVPLKRALGRPSDAKQAMFSEGRRSLPQQLKSSVPDRFSEVSKRIEVPNKAKGFQQRSLFDERRASSKQFCDSKVAIAVRTETASMPANWSRIARF